MAEEVSPESKLYVKEEIEKSRKEFKEDLKYAQSRATRTFSTVALIVGLLGSLGIYGLVKSALNDTTITKLESNATEKRNNIVEYEIKANKILGNLSKRQKIAHLPIGTILQSMLDPNSFAKEVGDPSVFDANECDWVLADGREVKNSQYSLLSGEPNTPDLRGVFLRGMNEGRNDGRQDPNDRRVAGDYQQDALQQHGHDTTATGYHENLPDSESSYRWGEGDLGYTTSGNADLVLANVTDVKDAKTDGETRPRNVAVYFYIKIN